MSAYVFETRVRYAETDQMGIVYHGNYLTYFEMGRIDLLRREGYSYAELEREGIRLPVVEVHLRYLHPARFDDLLEVETTVREVGAARVRFSYEIRRKNDGVRLVEGETTLATVDESGRPCRMRAEVRDALRRLLPE